MPRNEERGCLHGSRYRLVSKKGRLFFNWLQKSSAVGGNSSSGKTSTGDMSVRKPETSRE